MNAVFLDTGYVLALELANDSNHRAASEHWAKVSGSLPRLVTTSFVFDEIVTFLNRRKRHEKAVEAGTRLLTSPTVQFVHVDELLFAEAWGFFQQHADKDYSLTDCISFVLMKRLGLQTAYSFDQHFVQAGFTKEP